MQTEMTPPPPHLAEATQSWWHSVVADYCLEGHHLRLLQLAAEAWDRCQQARAIIDADGLSYLDRFDAPRARPEIAIERDSRLAFARLIRELDLDVDAPPPAARTPGIRSNRRT